MLQRPGGADQQRDQLGDPDVVAHGTGPLRAMVWTVARGHDLGLEDVADVSQVTWLLLTQHLGLIQAPSGWGSGCSGSPPVRPTACAGCAAGGFRTRADLRRQENGLSNSYQLLQLFHAKVMKITTKA